MSVFRISYRYANSLFLLAEEKNLLKKFSDDAELILNTIKKSKELKAVLKSPVVKSLDKKSILGKLFSDKITKDMSDFLNFCVEKNREDLITDIMTEFLNLRDQKNGILRTEVISAIELSDELKSNFVQKLEKQTNKTVHSNFILDSKIIGGFIIRIKDLVIDASVEHQLKLLKKKLLQEISIKNN